MTETKTEAGRAPRRCTGRGRAGLAAALIAAGAAGAGATALAQRGRAVAYVALEPAPIAAMKDGNLAAIKGRVAEVYGDKFVLDDGAGRALVEAGPRGQGLVAAAETVIVQGRFDRGSVHAVAVQHADGHTDVVGPPGPPPPPGPGPAPR